LYAVGRRLLEVFPCPPLSPIGARVAIGVVSYRHSRRVSRRTLLAANDRIGLQPAAKIVARRVCRRLQFCKRVRRRRSGGEGGPSWVSMRFGYGDGATNRATVGRYLLCCLADFSAAPLVGRS